MARDRLDRRARTVRPESRRVARPRLEPLEPRDLPATLAPIANQTVPQFLGKPVVLTGGTNNQTFTATSTNSAIQAQVINGGFLSITVSHTSSGANDPAFTGTIVLELFNDLTPRTVEKILSLVAQGFYTSPTQPPVTNPPTTPLPNKNFHRVVPGFVVQGGSRTGTGSGSLGEPGFPFADEFVQQLVFTGGYQLAMANSGDDSNDSQFFITNPTTSDTLRNLDFNHTIFGQVVAGQSVVDQIFAVARNTTTEVPTNPVLITATTVSPANPNGTLVINTTGAAAGQMGSITVTATDPSDMSTTTQTFQVTVGQNTGSTGQVLNERPFISPQLSNMTSATNQPAIFQIPFVNAEPTDTVSFTVRGGITTNPTTGNREFTNIQNATATVDANGIVRITPNNNFTGTINFVVGVRDQVQRGPTADSPDNFDTQTLTLTVRAGEQVNFAPVASPSTASIPFNTPTSVQLVGQTANPNSATQTLVFEIVSPPTQGTITDFNANTGQFTYTPPAGVVGTATLQFRVRDVGAPLPNLVSAPATVTFNIVGAMTGSVRVISNVLVVSAPPRTDGGRNTINVAESNGQIVVFVNGFLDETQPDVQDLDRIVIYGSKASDVLRVDPSVTLPTTINGGTGGKNVLLAGNGPSRLHGWFGKNRLRGGAVRDALLGRTRHVRFVESEGSDQLFAGNGRPGRDHGNLAPPSAAPRVRTRPPIGQFFRFVKGRLVPIPTPRPSLIQAQHPVGRNPNQ